MVPIEALTDGLCDFSPELPGKGAEPSPMRFSPACSRSSMRCSKAANLWSKRSPTPQP